MGVLDWLTDIGADTSMVGGALPQATPPTPPTPSPSPAPSAVQPTQAMPPVQGLDNNGPAPVQMTGSDVPPLAPAPSAGQPPIPVPMPRPRPASVNGAAALPPNATPTSGTGMPPIPPAAAPVTPPTPGGGYSTGGILESALGLDPNSAAAVRGALAKGLTSVGTNWNKPGLAAFSGSAGASIGGGQEAANKTLDQQDRFLQRELTLGDAGDKHALNQAKINQAKAYTKYLGDKGTGSGANSVLNSQQQLYLRGLAAVHSDPQIAASAANVRATQTQFGADSKEAKAAMDAHTQLVEDTKKRVLGTLGVDEKTAMQIGKQPGMSPENPVPKEGLTQQKFDALPPGAYFINPKDGRLLVKGAAKPQGAGANPPATPQSPPTPAPSAPPTPQGMMTPAVPPTPPTPGASGPASDDDED